MPAASTAKLKIACIGAGYFGQFQIEAWQRLQEVGDIAVVDPDAARRDSFGCRAYASVENMLSHYAPDIVDIITPPATHLEIIRQCLDDGVETVICQKPFCGNLSSAIRVFVLAEFTRER